MMYEIYKDNKIEYPNSIIIIKGGTFYNVINRDAFILRQICNYQIKRQSYGYKVGFPIVALGKVLNILEEKKINYILFEEKTIVDKKKYTNNHYNLYSNYQMKYEIIVEKLKILELQLLQHNEEFFDNILNKIGELV